MAGTGSLGDLSVSFSANLSNFTSGIRQAKGDLSGFSQDAERQTGGIGKMFSGMGAIVAGALIGTGVAAVGLGVKVAKMAGDFESQMTYLQTNAGELASNMGIISDGILSMASETGTATKDLAAGMFMVESAGYRGRDALKVELAAAEGAKIGHADLSQITDVLTTSMHDYAMQSDMAIPVMNSLIAAVGAGKMSMDDLNAALTNVLPVASKANISISDVEGALAAMAQAGDRGAGAGTHLSQMFSSLQNPTSKAKGILQEIGLTTQQISDEMKTSLPDAISMIYDALAKKFPVGSAAFNAAAAAIVGGNKQMKAWNELTGTSFAGLTAYSKITADALKAHADAVSGWAKVQGDFNQQMDETKGAIEAIGIKLGTMLLPALSNVLNFVNPLIDDFSQWVTNSQGLSKALQPVGDSLHYIYSTIASVDLHPIIQGFKDMGQGLVGLGQATGGGSGLGNLIPVTLSSALMSVTGLFKSLGDDWKNDIEPGLAKLQPAFDALAQTLNTAMASSITQVTLLLSGQFSASLKWLATTTQNLSRWFKNDLSPAIAEATPKFGDLGRVLLDTVVPALVKLNGIVLTTGQHIVTDFLPVFEKASPVVVKLSGDISEGLALSLKFLTPQVIAAATAMSQFATTIAVTVSPPLQHFWDTISVGLDWLQAHWFQIWPTLSGFLKGIWDGIVGIVRFGWDLITGMFVFTLDVITLQWGKAWTDLKSMLSNVWSDILLFLQGCMEQINVMFGGLPGMAYNAGASLISGFISGVGSMLGSLWSTMSSVAADIAGFLPQSPAKHGELSHLNEYGPALVRGISQGIVNSKPTLEAAMNMTLSPFVALPHVGSSSGGTAYPLSSSGGTSGGHSGPVNIYMMMDGKIIGHAVAPHIVQEMRIKAGVRQ